MKFLEKQKAIALRKNGESIKEIAKKVGVSKSSISLWVRNISLSKKQVLFLKLKGFSSTAIENRRISRLTNERLKREAVMFEAGRIIKDVSYNDLRLIGLCLYWGEGGKTQRGSARVSNSDPDIIKTMIRFFREVCLVEKKTFRGQLHIHSHMDAEKAEKYWSKVTGIPRKQFYKTYSKPSIASKSKKDSLPYGTFDIYVSRTKLFLEIMGQIEKLKKLLLRG